jgi:hypothetical protein
MAQTESASAALESEATPVTEEQTGRPTYYTVDVEKPLFSPVDGKRLSHKVRQQFAPRAFAQFKAQATQLGYTYTVIDGPTDE